MQVIEHIELNSNQSTVTLSAIPADYDDLLIVVSARTTYTSTIDSTMRMTFNNDTTASYDNRVLYGNGSTGSSFASTYGYVYTAFTPSSATTSNTFGNVSIYIPNYAGSTNKSVSIDAVHENNATGAYQSMTAALWNNTSAINEIDFTTNNNPYVTYSSFTIYGITSGSSGGVTVS